LNPERVSITRQKARKSFFISIVVLGWFVEGKNNQKIKQTNRLPELESSPEKLKEPIFHSSG
jgi:hypothetical protein